MMNVASGYLCSGLDNHQSSQSVSQSIRMSATQKASRRRRGVLNPKASVTEIQLTVQGNYHSL